jgi:hypothetical protein
MKRKDVGYNRGKAPWMSVDKLGGHEPKISGIQ